MLSVGLKTLKKNLNEYIRVVSTGETVFITDGDRVVAELVPPRQTPAVVLSDAVLGEAVQRGPVTAAVLPPSPPPWATPMAPLSELVDELESDRADR